ncbi:heat shock 70 kDa protein 12A-like, partial [Saccostrea cucullata]
GTGDFTVHEKLDNGKLKEVSKASGGAFGGINVDKRLFHFFSKLFGEEAFTQLKSEEICDYLDIFRDFEIKKRTVTDDCEKNYVIRLPSSLLQFASNNNPGFRKNAESTDFKGHVNFWHDKLKIDSTLMKSLFTESIQNITTHIEGILQGFPKVRQILLVGGYGECIILQDDIRKCFPQQDLIIPQECELAVVKGAVLFGHDSKVIFERILRYSYGTNSHSKFDPSVHCEDRKYVDDYGITRCRGSFYTLVKAGEKITSKGHIISSAIFALSKNQSEIEYKIFYTEKTNTIYLDDDCKFLGKLIIPLTGDKDTNRKCNVSFTFGLTEICCKVTEKSSGRDIEAKFEMLE